MTDYRVSISSISMSISVPWTTHDLVLCSNESGTLDFSGLSWFGLVVWLDLELEGRAGFQNPIRVPERRRGRTWIGAVQLKPKSPSELIGG